MTPEKGHVHGLGHLMSGGKVYWLNSKHPYFNMRDLSYATFCDGTLEESARYRAFSLVSKRAIIDIQPHLRDQENAVSR